MTQAPPRKSSENIVRAPSPTNTVARASLIIVNWNGCHHLEPCLAALRAQTQRPDEIIVVDNGSLDDSVAFIRRCHPEVKLLELSENKGFTGGNIAGYEVASGDYIILLNNDTKPLPDWLERLVRCADARPDVGIVASHMTDWDGRNTDAAGDGCSVTGRGFKLHMNQPTSIPLQSRYVFSACAGAALYKRAMLKEVGFLDPRFFMNAEDTDLAFRAQLRGWKVYFCAEAVVRHRIGGSQGVYTNDSAYYSSRNHIWMYLRCMPSKLMLKYGLSFLLHTALYILFFARRRQAGRYLAGLFDALRQLPAVLRERRLIQAARKVSVADIEVQLAPLSQVLSDKWKAHREWV